MTPGGNRNKRVVWQDVTPLKPTQQAATKIHRKRLHIRLPKRPKLFKISRRRLIILTILLVAAVLALLIVHNFMPTTSSTAKQNSSATNNSSKSSAGKLVPGTPKYAIILPAGKSIKDLGGGNIRSDSQPSFVYVDKIGSVKINVSEQPMPNGFKDDPVNKVAQLAQASGASEKIAIGSNTIYIGSFDSGLQRVIFSKADLLVLITSNSHLTDNDWVVYVNSLN